MERSDRVAELRTRYSRISERIQQRTGAARQLLFQLASLSQSLDSSACSPIPSSNGILMSDSMKLNSSTVSLESMDQTSHLSKASLSETIHNDSTEAGTLEWHMWTPREFKVRSSPISVREVWEEWKQGTRQTPSIEYMNRKFGPLAWAESIEDLALLVSRYKVVEEIERQLKAGAIFGDALDAAQTSLEDCNNDIQILANQITRNQHENKPTFVCQGLLTDSRK